MGPWAVSEDKSSPGLCVPSVGMPLSLGGGEESWARLLGPYSSERICVCVLLLI